MYSITNLSLLLTVIVSLKVFHEGHPVGADEARLHSHQADQSFDTGPDGKAGGGKPGLG